MDLYDDIDTKPKASQIDGWSSGIKMLQTQLAIKKAQVPKEQPKKTMLTPILNLRNKKNDDEQNRKEQSRSVITLPKAIISAQPLVPVLENMKTDDWDFIDEYDPLWPNEYEKLIKERQNKEKDSRSGRENNSDRKRTRARGTIGSSVSSQHQNKESSPAKFAGLGQRQLEEETYNQASNNKGAAIAPPPSLQEISINNGDNSSNVTIPYSASSVAAKIMAKYGFKDGQGLGKQEQGMSMALQVEKTSKRGGRIIHEKDVFVPPTQATGQSNLTLPVNTPVYTCGSPSQEKEETAKSEPTITEIMKQPSKVVLLRNMVGPGDVDEELEPEVKDECNTKYGDVVNVIIHESFGTAPEDAVKIYVEFKRIESAIKAVVDLNGRFFGGRQVRAGFYNFDKFKSLQLN